MAVLLQHSKSVVGIRAYVVTRGGSDASHLGLWSVGRGEENRLLIANMSRVWCFYLRSENRGHQSRGHGFDGWFLEGPGTLRSVQSSGVVKDAGGCCAMGGV